MRALRTVLLLALFASTLFIRGSMSPVLDSHTVTLSTLAHGRFENVRIFAPGAAPRGFVLFLSDSAGWNVGMELIARDLARRGAMVAGIDTAGFIAALEADGADCEFPAGDLENLAHFVQAYAHLADYLPPILAGYGAGGTLAYGVLAQAPTSTFVGAVSFEFCPQIPMRKDLCKGSALEAVPRRGGDRLDLLPSKQLENPWMVFQSFAVSKCSDSAVRDFVGGIPHAELLRARKPLDYSVFDRLIRSLTAVTATVPEALRNLPIVAVKAQGNAEAADLFAILLSGDGGWAGLDKEVAETLSADGIPVIGLDSLRYFWTARTPAGLAADLEQMITYYLAKLGKERVMLIGYSQGADVLPFAVNRLQRAIRARVAVTAVMGMSERAVFEFHVSNWLSDDASGAPTLPEMQRLRGSPVLCIYGDDETDSLCPRLSATQFTIVKLKGGHHFDGDYTALARTLLAAARR